MRESNSHDQDNAVIRDRVISDGYYGKLRVEPLEKTPENPHAVLASLLRLLPGFQVPKWEPPTPPGFLPKEK